MKAVEDNSQTGKSMSDILERLKDWHLSNVHQRKAQITASNAKFLVVKETTNKSSHIKPTVGDIVVINTTKDSRNIGQIIAIERQTAKVLCQDRIFRQPISYLTPLYTETDKDQDMNTKEDDTHSSVCTATLPVSKEALYEGFDVNTGITGDNKND